MASTSLRSYIREIEKHIESGRNDEAIAHCRYILESYPKYTDTYRLLGKAFLESQRYGDAADIFQRVLSSIPDDFVAHVGMSIIREDEGNLDEAIWHMERAFEIQPANSAIQDELRRLYGRRDGVEPPKIRLTRGALARMYYKGGLYQQAVAETRTALAENANRLDLQVLLAEIYTKTGQRAEAADAANSILKKIPYCLTANQIMAASLSDTDRDQEAQVFRQRLNKLDPYAAFIGPNNPNAASVPDQAITLEKLEWKPGQMIGKSEGQPAWAASLGVELGEMTPGKEEALPEWLSSASTEKPIAPISEGSRPSPPAFTLDSLEEISASEQLATPLTSSETTVPEEEIPEWMKAIGEDIPTGQVMEPEVDLSFTKGEDQTAIGSEDGELAAAEIPDWLRAMAPIPGLEGTPKAEADISPWVDEISTQDIAEVASDQSKSTTERVVSQKGYETPEWMISDEASIETGDGEDALSGIPDWLAEEAALPESLTEEGALQQEEEVVYDKTTTPEGELPAWLFESENIPDKTTLEEGLKKPPSFVSIESPPVVIEPSALDQKIPGWLPEKEAPPAGEEEMVSEDAFVSETEVPLPALSIEEEPAILIEEELAPSPTLQEETVLEETAEEIPDWLKEISVASAVEVPEWLLEEEAPPAILPPVEVGVREQIEPETLSPEKIIEREEEPISDSQPTQTVPSEQVSVSPQEIIEPTIEAEAAAEVSTQESAPQENREEVFAWLEDMAVQKEDEGAVPGQEPGIPVSETEPSVALSEDEAAFAWLEGLAVKQGAEEALLLKPEERLETPPEWIKLSMEDETTEGRREEIPSVTVISSEETAPSAKEGFPQPEIPTAIELETISEEVSETSFEEEIVTLPIVELETIPETEQETSIPPEAVEEISKRQETLPETVQEIFEIPEEEFTLPVQKTDLNEISLAELERLPGVGFITAQRILDFRETNGPFTTLDDLLRIPEFSPATLEEIKDHLYVEIVEATPISPFEDLVSIPKEGETPVKFEQAKKSLIQGNLEQTLEKYAIMIQSGQELPQIIRDLEDISHRYPQEIQVWQKLGDAYLRSDQIQEALNAYVEAERLLL